MTQTRFDLRTPANGADIVIVDVAGEIDMETAPELQSRIGAVGNGARRIVVNLAEVTFLDSSALNALLHCQRELARREVVLRVVSPADRAVSRVFELTRLAELLGVVETFDEALA